MELGIITAGISIAVNFGTLLSYYWKIQIKNQEFEHRLKHLEDKNNSFDDLNKKIFRIEVILEHIQDKLKA